MIAIVDVDYRGTTGVAACILAAHWTDARAFEDAIARIDRVAPYEPGRFYLRELPCVVAAVQAASVRADVVVVDGYVWLDEGRPGLGAHVHAALGVPVVGVAKTAFAGATSVLPVLRGRSTRPLFVSSVGMDVEEAAAHVRAMHGPFRTPTLLREADRRCREA